LSFSPPLTNVEVEAGFNGSFGNVRTIVGGVGGQGVVFKASPKQQAKETLIKDDFPIFNL